MKYPVGKIRTTELIRHDEIFEVNEKDIIPFNKIMKSNTPFVDRGGAITMWLRDGAEFKDKGMWLPSGYNYKIVEDGYGCLVLIAIQK